MFSPRLTPDGPSWQCSPRENYISTSRRTNFSKLSTTISIFRLSLIQRDFGLGTIPFCEFSVKSRNSIETLKLIDSQKKMLLAFGK